MPDFLQNSQAHCFGPRFCPRTVRHLGDSEYHNLFFGNKLDKYLRSQSGASGGSEKLSKKTNS